MNDFTSFCVAGFFLIWAPTATAQEDQRFFGRWLPASTSAGGWPLIVEPGRIYDVIDNGEIGTEEHYQVIRDFGDQLLIKSWYVKHFVEGAGSEPSLTLLSVSEHPAYEKYPPYLLLEIDNCSGMYTEAYFFSDDDLEKTWVRILAWSKQKGEFPEELYRDVNRCVIEWADGKVTLPGANGMGFYRELQKN